MSDASRPARWIGLDALRGLSIAAMILVNNPGRWGADFQYGPLRHAEWHGCTFTDLVFPTFLFCAGVAIVPALSKKVAAGVPRAPLATGIGRRVLWLVLLGMMLSAFPFVRFETGKDWLSPLLHVRFPGVLQRIGVCYGLAALLFLFTPVRMQRFVLLVSLVGYWVLLAVTAMGPGVDAPSLDDPVRTLQGQLDRAVFGDHIYVKGKYDPEGLLSTLPALGTCLLGVEAGRLLAAGSPTGVTARRLGRFAVLLLAVGWVWSFAFPFNKPLWTSSYAVWTAGIAAALLAGCVALGERDSARRWLAPLQVYGVNALLVFVGSGLLGRILGSLWTVTVDGKEIAVKEWFFRAALLSWLPPKVASLAFALLWVAGWYLVLRALFRRGIVWKV